MSRANSTRLADATAEHTRIFFTVPEARTAAEEPLSEPAFRPADVRRQTLSGPLMASAIQPSQMIAVGTAAESNAPARNASSELARAGEPVTQYFPVELLLSRRQAGDAPEQVENSAPLPAPETPITDPDLALYGLRPSLLSKARRLWQRLSTVNRISVGLVPLLVATLLAGRWVGGARAPVHRPAPRIAAPAVPVTTPPRAADATEAAAIGASPALTSARNGLSRKAADAVGEGRYDAALELYRKLALREPTSVAYREAVRILERRAALDPDRH